MSTNQRWFSENVFQKKPPEFFLQLLQRLSKIISLLFLKLYIQNYPGFTTMEWRYTMDSSDSWPCRVFLHICVTILPTPKKNVGTERSPISLMTIILHRTKAVISSIIPLYIVKREIKNPKKPHPVHRMIYPNKRLWALYQQKSCNIACPAEITIHIQIPMRFPPWLSLLSLSLTYSS